MNDKTLELLLLDLVGDNVGSDCDCGKCESNRQTIRDAVETLILAEREACAKIADDYIYDEAWNGATNYHRSAENIAEDIRARR